MFSKYFSDKMGEFYKRCEIKSTFRILIKYVVVYLVLVSCVSGGR